VKDLSFRSPVKYNRHFQPKAENAGEQKGRLPVKAQVHEAQQIQQTRRSFSKLRKAQ